MSSLSLFRNLLAQQMAVDSLIVDIDARAENVDLYRRYDEGDHEFRLPEQLRLLLNVRRADVQMYLNYIPLIIDTEAGRLILTGFSADNDTAGAWAAELAELNGMDNLQITVHRACLRDGDTFVMTSYDPETGRARLTHEEAYDGITGIVPIYKSPNLPDLDCMLKFWHITAESGQTQDKVRCNVYYPDRIERYISINGGSFGPYENLPDEPAISEWRDGDGQPLGIPIVHFRNRPRRNYGLSEIDQAIGPQDAINRMSYTLLLSTELDSGQIRYIIGAALSNQAITPGAFLQIAESGLDKDSQVSVGVLPGGDPEKNIKALQYWIQQLGRITATPAPEIVAEAGVSGELLKQMEVSLIAKIRNAQINFGASWESVFDMAHRVELAFAPANPPAYSRFYTEWADPEIRNDQDYIKSVNETWATGQIDQETYLELLSGVYGWDQARIDRIIRNVRLREADRLRRTAAAAVPDLGGNQPLIEQEDNQDG